MKQMQHTLIYKGAVECRGREYRCCLVQTGNPLSTDHLGFPVYASGPVCSFFPAPREDLTATDGPRIGITTCVVFGQV